MAERIPISMLLGGQNPDTVQPAEPGLPPVPPGAAGAPPRDDPLRMLVDALVSIPEVFSLVQEILMRRQALRGGAGMLGPGADMPPEEPGPGMPGRSFADKLAELRARR